MGGNYEKGVYNQLMEVMEKLNSMELEHKRDRKEIRNLSSEIKSLRRENIALREELSGLKEKNAALEEVSDRLEKENRLLRDDNERMKRTIRNDSSNSSAPPSKDLPGKAPNTFNSRKPTKKKLGAQKGHKGHGLSKADVQQKVRDGIYEHRIETIGVSGRAYITRYRLDLDVKTIATEIRIYADDNGKFQVPEYLFCIVKAWLPMTGSVLLSIPFPEIPSAFQPEVCMGSAGSLGSPVPAYAWRLKRNC